MRPSPKLSSTEPDKAILEVVYEMHQEIYQGGKIYDGARESRVLGLSRILNVPIESLLAEIDSLQSKGLLQKQEHEEIVRRGGHEYLLQITQTGIEYLETNSKTNIA